MNTPLIIDILFQVSNINQLTETKQPRMIRFTGTISCQCAMCKTGTMQKVEILYRIVSSDNVFPPQTNNLNL